MSLFFITGLPGAGKTSVCEYLKSYGKAAYDVDDGFATHFDQNGRERDHWERDFLFLLLPAKIDYLKKESEKANVFLCGNTSRPENYLSLFDRIVFLELELDVLKERLRNRPDNPFGKDPESLQAVIDYYPSTNRFWSKLSQTNKRVKIVDASLSLREVADEITCFCIGSELAREAQR